MGAQCTICPHPKRELAERALTDGASFREVAEQFGMTKSALHRHQVNCMALIGGMSIEELIDHYRMLDAEAEELFSEAKAAQNIRDANSVVNTRAKLANEIQKAIAANASRLEVAPITEREEWAAFAAQLVAALSPYPDALAAVEIVLGEVK